VVPVNDLHGVLKEDSSKYLAKSFPGMVEGTVIEVESDEQAQWQPGFYRAIKRPAEFEEYLRAV